MFRIGQRVVCIDDSLNPETAAYTPCHPIKGQTYIIRGLVRQPHIEGYGVYLEECLNPVQMWSDNEDLEWPFRPDRFRPVVELPFHEETVAGLASLTIRKELA